MKVWIGLIFLSACAVTSGKKCFAPVLCMVEDASYPEWMQVFPTLRSASERTCPKIPPTKDQERQKIYENAESLLKNKTDSLRNETDAKLGEMKSELEQQLNSTVNSLKNDVKNLNEKVSRMELTLNATMKKLRFGPDCELTYNGNCFRVILHGKYYVNFTVAETMCNNGWKLANIYSKGHYDEVARYLRKKVADNNMFRSWLGMTYDQNTTKIYLSDGTQLMSELPWFSGYPSVTAIKMCILVHKNSDTNQGMVNLPAKIDTRGVLCEI